MFRSIVTRSFTSAAQNSRPVTKNKRLLTFVATGAAVGVVGGLALGRADSDAPPSPTRSAEYSATAGEVVASTVASEIAGTQLVPDELHTEAATPQATPTPSVHEADLAKPNPTPKLPTVEPTEGKSPTEPAVPLPTQAAAEDTVAGESQHVPGSTSGESAQSTHVHHQSDLMKTSSHVLTPAAPQHGVHDDVKAGQSSLTPPAEAPTESTEAKARTSPVVPPPTQAAAGSSNGDESHHTTGPTSSEDAPSTQVGTPSDVVATPSRVHTPPAPVHGVQDTESVGVADDATHAKTFEPSDGDDHASRMLTSSLEAADPETTGERLDPSTSQGAVASTDSSTPNHYEYVVVGGGAASAAALDVLTSALHKQQQDGTTAGDRAPRVLFVSASSRLPYTKVPLSKELLEAAVASTGATDSTDKKGDDAVETLTYRADGVRGRRSVTLCPDPLPSTVEARLGTVVDAVDPDARAVLLDDESIVYFDKLILAPGSRPRHFPRGAISDAAVPFVQYYEGVGDFRRLAETLNGSQAVAVVGGGRLGTELAASLASDGNSSRSVSLLSRTGLPMSRWWPPYLAGAVAAELDRVGVTVFPDTAVTDIAAADDGMAASVAVTGKDATSPIRADRVVLAVGSEPNVDLGRAAGLEIDSVNGGIAVSSELQTSRSHLYAAGDGASVFEPVLGRRRVQHEEDAVASGAAAARSALGDRAPFHDLPRATGRIGRLRYSSVGRIDSSLPTVGIFDETAPSDERLHRGIVYYFDESKNTVAGVLMVGVRGREGEAAKLVGSERPYYDKAGLAPRFISIEDGQ